MELQDYIQILWRRGWIIALVALIGGASALFFSLQQTPVYSASVELSVQPARADWGLSNTVKDLLRNYVENIQTYTKATEVIERAKLDMTANRLLSQLYVSSDPSTFSLKIEARDYDPLVAQQIAQTVGEVFVEDRQAWNQKQDKRDRIDVQIRDNVYNRGYSLHSPRKKINTLAGVVFGGLLGGLTVFALEWTTRDLIRTSRDAERELDVAVLGAIPAHSSEGMSSNPQVDLITLADPRSPVAEAYRSLCTNLTFAGLEEPLRTLLVTSAESAEGKSTNVANLAVTMAEREMRTIVVDCDLRNPVQHEIFDLSNERGFTSLFTDEGARSNPPLQRVGVENLWVLPSGPPPPIPSQLLGSRRLPEIIASLSEEADMVLFDAPPLIPVSDASMMAPHVDGVLLVVSAGRTKREHLRRAKQRLARVHAYLVGAVMNNVPLDARLRRYYG
ncbi:MAG: polysaccharide biosynthesis tyrosine autokinase [Chloroflexota bacterium]|nr:polysaccharide biosynthesis tyrosine autokinase [Chloroflexota bacterium]